MFAGHTCHFVGFIMLWLISFVLHLCTSFDTNFHGLFIFFSFCYNKNQKYCRICSYTFLDYAMVLSFQSDRSNSVDQNQEQSDEGLHYLPFRLHLLDTLR